MSTARTLRRHLAELVVVFVGVALAFAVENLREDLNERAVEAQYLSGYFDSYLYDPTFSSIPFRPQCPWDDTPENRRHVETILGDLRVENGLRLIVANVADPGMGLLSELESARSQVERLLDMIPPE